jgi:acyl-CoA thioester hydrolase
LMTGPDVMRSADGPQSAVPILHRDGLRLLALRPGGLELKSGLFAALNFRRCTCRRGLYAAPMAAPFHHPHRVSYADCTVGNHVYYSRYLDFLETGRGEFIRSLGPTMLEWQERDVIFPVLEARLRYRSPARYDDLLTIAVWPAAVERVRLNFGYRIVNQDGKSILEAETCHVCAGVSGKPRRLPEELAERLKPFLSEISTPDSKGNE